MKKLLVVDDSPFIAKEITALVEGEGYEVIGFAKNGEEGIERYKELKPDVLTLDIIMPGIDGIETAREILKIDPKARIIMLSSLYDYDTMQEIENLGLKYLIAKPIEHDQLMNVLNEICKGIEEG